MVLILCAVSTRPLLPAWGYMWCLAFALYAASKWSTWATAHSHCVPCPRSLAYLLLWPGMDAKAFLFRAHSRQPSGAEWMDAGTRVLIGAVLLWGVAPLISAPLVQGWIGMFGIVMILHFGVFQLLALFWQRRGIPAEPLMQAPLRSTSLSEFWNKRWNRGFNQLAHELVFKRLFRRHGLKVGILLTFFASGLVHDLVISLPARAGYGLPTLYFLLQGLGVILERGLFAKALAARPLGWLYTFLFTALPLPLLFHRPFLQNVILPFLNVLGAIERPIA